MGREGRMARAPEGQAKAVTRDPSLDVLKQSGKLLDAMDAAISSEAAKWSKLLYGTVEACHSCRRSARRSGRAAAQ